jgi:hypothetical protein
MPCHDSSGSVDGGGGQPHDLAALSPGRNPRTYCVQEAESATVPVQTGVEKGKSVFLTGF